MSTASASRTDIPPLLDDQIRYGNFERVTSFTPPKSSTPIQKWRSTKTGLSVVWAGIEGPIVNGSFVLGTEIFDDTGRPHTLEHLVFLGSEQYPYKGILDNLANKSFADGTNAWTDTDHTAYTIGCAGGEGFLKILPVYVDHILYPTLTDEGFTTEVHHVDGQGENAGVVYAEMQARENGSSDLMALQLQRMIYPKSNAYRSETGGVMSALRALTVEQIREYHASLYVPHNLTLLVVGLSCPLDALLHTLNTVVEPSILSHPPARTEGWKRPFLETSTGQGVKWPKGDRVEVVEFMESDETVGEVQVAFGNGVARTNWVDCLAIDVLTTYLTDSPIAPLNKAFVEIPEPFCTSIDLYTATRHPVNEMTLYISDVPVEHLDAISGLVRAELRQIADKGVDMDRMAMVLRRERRQVMHSLEGRPESMVEQSAIGDLLYGDDEGKQLEETWQIPHQYDTLAAWSAEQWTAFLRKYLVDAPTITINGKPSAALAKKIEKAEKARIKAQKTALGEAGLKAKEEELRLAKAFNDRDIPKEVLDSFGVPDVKSVTWIEVETAINDPMKPAMSTGPIQTHVDADGSTPPFHMHFANTKSNFYSIDLFLSTFNMPAHLRPYAALWQDSFFSLPVTRADGTELSHEQVITQLNDQTVEYFTDDGAGGICEDLMRVQFKVEREQYASAVAWLRDLVWASHFSIDRLEVSVAKLRQELPQRKRDGDGVSQAMSRALVFDESKSTAVANGLLRQIDFLPELARRIKDEPTSVVRDLEAFRAEITKPENIRIAISGSILQLPNPRAPFLDHFPALPPTAPSPTPFSRLSLSPLGASPRETCEVVQLSSIEGSYAQITGKGIAGWDHPELAAVEVTKAVMNALESYLWKFIRGSGLAYGAGVTASVEAGTVGFYVYRSPNAYTAFKEAARVIEGLVSGTIELEPSIVLAAKSSLVYSFARREKTMSAAASTAFVNESLKAVPLKFGRAFLARVQEVDDRQILDVLARYFLPLFKNEGSVVALACAPGKHAELVEGFGRDGWEIVERSLAAANGDDDDDSEMESGSGSGTEDDEEGTSTDEDDEMTSATESDEGSAPRR